MGYSCLFTNIDATAFRRSDGSLAFKGVLDGKWSILQKIMLI
jgi:hypothetical protein